MSIYSVMPFNHFILCCPLLLLPSIFPSIRSFPMSQFFTLGGKSIGVSASVFSMNIQDWFPLGWTGLISLQSRGLTTVFSNTAVQKHRFFSARLSLWSNSTFIHDYWRNTALTRLTFVGKVMCLLFNMLSRLGHSFSSKEKTSFNFMAAATICSDFGAQ